MTKKLTPDDMKDAMDDFETIEDVIIGDDPLGDPDVVEITIRGRLRKELKRHKQETDYDRAMKGVVVAMECNCDGIGVCHDHTNPEFFNAIQNVDAK